MGPADIAITPVIKALQSHDLKGLAQLMATVAYPLNQLDWPVRRQQPMSITLERYQRISLGATYFGFGQ